MRCRFCSGADLAEVVDFGEQPISHFFLSSVNEHELTYRLVVHSCGMCGLTQICEPVDPEILYSQDSFCCTSGKAQRHLEAEVQTILSHADGASSVFEIGCNDGIFLDALRSRGFRSLDGVEPNPLALAAARAKGLAVRAGMLSESLCREAVGANGPFGLVIARQVLEHLPRLREFFECARTLLRDDGLLFIDIPDPDDALAMGDCSVIWEEHVNYFSEATICNALLEFGFQPLSIERYNYSGGTLAILAQRLASVVQLARRRQSVRPLGFAEKVSAYGRRLRPTLERYRASGYRVALYGVGCRACIVVNGLQLAPYIDFALDDDVSRQGLFMPGSKITIRSPKGLGAEPLVCLLAVNQENEADVKSRLCDIMGPLVEFGSVCAPNDIWSELDRLETRCALGQPR